MARANSGAAVNKFIAPALVLGFGWTMVPKVYAAVMLGTAILFWIFSYSDPAHLVSSHVTWRDQLKALKDPRVWKYSQYYSIVFGGYVALALWMPQYYVGEFSSTCRPPHCSAAFSLPGGVLRAIGGWLSDKYGAPPGDLVGAVGLLDLPLPAVLPADGHDDPDDQWPQTFHVGLNVYLFTILMFVMGIAWAFGKASVFKYISDDFTDKHRCRLGRGRPRRRPRRLLPADHVRILLDLTGIRSSAFMLLYGVVWVSLIWMYWTEVRKAELMGPRSKKFSLKG